MAAMIHILLASVQERERKSGRSQNAMRAGKVAPLNTSSSFVKTYFQLFNLIYKIRLY